VHAGDGAHVREEVRVREGDALGLAGAPRGVLDEREVRGGGAHGDLVAARRERGDGLDDRERADAVAGAILASVTSALAPAFSRIATSRSRYSAIRSARKGG
jgi:hypothetical protein